MLYLIAILVGLGIGRLRGGRIAHLAGLRLRWLWLVPLSLAIQLLIFPLFSGAPLVAYGTAPLHLASYGLVILWMALNLRVVPLRGFLVGAALNLVAVVANGGYMPASAAALRRAGLDQTAQRLLDGDVVANVILMSPSTHLNALGDWLSLPSWVPFSTAFSIGDVLIMIGLVWLTARGMIAGD